MTNPNAILPSELSVDDILTEIMERDPMVFIESKRTVKGYPFKIIDTGRDYLQGIFEYILFEAIKKTGKPLVVVKGRQVEFTETMLNVCLYILYHYNNITILYSFPTADQVRRFSRDRFSGAIRESQGGSLKDMIIPGGSQNVHHKQFSGNTQIFMYSAWGQADTLRGITCDVMVKDEVQDWSTEGVQNTKECMAQSLYKLDLSIGTPKSEGTYYHEIWENSDQRYYHAKCIHCPEYFKITLNVCKRGTIVECPKCHQEQEKKDAIKDGIWIPEQTEIVAKNGKTEEPDYVGFHVSQLMHPNITIEEIYQKRKEYGERKWRNEVLGEFTGSMDRPLSPQDIVNMINDNGWNKPEWAFPPTIAPPEETIMGIDWGGNSKDRPRGSYTVIVIVKPVIGTVKYQVVFAKRIVHPSHEKQVEEISSLIYKYNCQHVIADVGYGHVQIEMLHKEFGRRISACKYSTNVRNEYNFDPERMSVTVDRDYALEELFQELMKKQWIIPGPKVGIYASSNEEADDADPDDTEDTSWLIHHLCNIEIVDVFRNGNTRKSFQRTLKPCDGLHALNYARIGLILKGHIIRRQSIVNGAGTLRPVLSYFKRTRR